MTNSPYKALVNFASKIGYKVVETDCDSWHYGSRIISNNKNRLSENRVIYLSHECGHAVLYEEKKENYDIIFSGLFGKNNIKYKVSELEQEVLAWDRALEILENLEINFDLTRYSKVKADCLKQYI